MARRLNFKIENPLAVNVPTMANRGNRDYLCFRIHSVKDPIITHANAETIGASQLFHAWRERFVGQPAQRFGNAFFGLVRKSSQFLFCRPLNFDAETHDSPRSFRTSASGRLGSLRRDSIKMLSCKSSHNSLSVIRNRNTRSRSPSGRAWISAINSAALISAQYPASAPQTTQKFKVQRWFEEAIACSESMIFCKTL